MTRSSEETMRAARSCKVLVPGYCKLSILAHWLTDLMLANSDVAVRKRSKRRSIKFARAKKLQKGFKAVIDKIKRLRLRIRVKGLDRFRRHCQCFPVLKLTMAQRKEQKYQKLE
jgi:hypothetical protein